jgi:hypothetical protein
MLACGAVSTPGTALEDLNCSKCRQLVVLHLDHVSSGTITRVACGITGDI